MNNIILEALLGTEETPLPVTDQTNNRRTAILDVTCAPANIRYPRDASLLNEARPKLEKMIGWFYQEYKLDKKPQTYCRLAHQEYLAFAKMKRPGAAKTRATVRKQLEYVRRDIRYVGEFLTTGYAMKNNFAKQYPTIKKLYDQQKYMFDNKTHSVADRIVSLSQPFVRPIVRGKTKTPTEFGAKFDVSLDTQGFARIEKFFVYCL